MELNCIVLPAPAPSYFGDEDFRTDGNLIFIPMQREDSNTNEEDKIIGVNQVIVKCKHKVKETLGYAPCYYIPYHDTSEG